MPSKAGQDLATTRVYAAEDEWADAGHIAALDLPMSRGEIKVWLAALARTVGRPAPRLSLSLTRAERLGVEGHYHDADRRILLHPHMATLRVLTHEAAHWLTSETEPEDGHGPLWARARLDLLLLTCDEWTMGTLRRRYDEWRVEVDDR